MYNISYIIYIIYARRIAMSPDELGKREMPEMREHVTAV
jgi:hypothetical protein